MQHPDHQRHDLILIAGLAAGDLLGPERAEAQAAIDTCADCADLYRDLLAIAAATHALPTTATPARDFRLTPEQASHLRRQGWLRTILAPFGTARSAARPIAAAFTSLGIAGLLVATLLPGLTGSLAFSAAGEARDQSTASGEPNAAVGATQAPAAPEPAAPEVDPGGPAAPASQDPEDMVIKGGNSETGVPRGAFGGGTATQAPGEVADDAGRPSAAAAANPLFIGSLALLALGLLLFGVRLAARRLR